MAKAAAAVLCAEVLVVTALLLLTLRGLMYISWGPVHEYSSIIFLILGVYGPLLILRWRGRRITFLERSMRDVLRSLATFLVVALIIFPPYLLVAHLYQHWIGGFALHTALRLWPGWELVIAQMLLVALPEEFFFRGYVQSTLDQVLTPRWKIFGVRLGWSWLLTALLFAFAHSVITYQWWHFAIFFPALAFGYLRERTGGLVAPMLFHALSNIATWWLSVNYG